VADDTKPKPPPDISPAAVDAALDAIEAREHKKWRSSIRAPGAAQADRGLAAKRGPYKLNEEVQKKIVAGILLGLTLERAAAAANVNRVTVFRWLKAGAAGEEPYAAFLAACKEADARCELDLLKTIKESSLGIKNEATGTFKQWTAAAWILERRFRYLAPKAPWVPDATEPDAASQNGGVALADLVGAKAAMAVNTGAEAPVDPADRVRELETALAQTRAELEASRAASGQSDDATPGREPAA